jgi:glutamine synthetase
MTQHAAAAQTLLRRICEQNIERVRIGWFDLHGTLRSKTVAGRALASALQDGVGLVSTVLLKDTADRTAFKIFEPGALAGLAGFGAANNVLMRPDPASFCVLPWAAGTGWLRCDLHFDDGTPVAVDPRHALRSALARLAQHGYGLRCGLEVEFHIYRIVDDGLDTSLPSTPPRMRLLHPGQHLLSDACADMAWACRCARLKLSSAPANLKPCLIRWTR